MVSKESRTDNRSLFWGKMGVPVLVGSQNGFGFPFGFPWNATPKSEAKPQEKRQTQILVSQRLLGLSMKDPTPPIHTPEVVGGLKTRLFEGPKSIGSLWVGDCQKPHKKLGNSKENRIDRPESLVRPPENPQKKDGQPQETGSTPGSVQVHVVLPEQFAELRRAQSYGAAGAHPRQPAHRVPQTVRDPRFPCGLDFQGSSQVS